MPASNYPRYSYPPAEIYRLAVDVLLGRHRDFRKDATACIGRLKPSLRVLGEANIPKTGPCVLTFNHYYRPGFNAWWMAFAIASVVPVEMYWIMTSELTFPGKFYAPLGMPISRILLSRAGRMYGFTTMPPMPPRPGDVEARARAVREVLSYVKKHRNAILGLAPEGGDNPSEVLTWPPSGAGRFILLLAEAGLQIIPAGAYEADGAFCLGFGPQYRLEVPRGLPPAGKDRSAAEIVMRRIAAQLPDHLRGEFG